jgi:hypothetical protein
MSPATALTSLRSIGEITILPADTPYTGHCSRCQGDIDPRSAAVLIWCGAEFWYCGACRERMGL